jgi:hypothetical protein
VPHRRFLHQADGSGEKPTVGSALTVVEAVVWQLLDSGSAMLMRWPVFFIE